MFAAQKPLPHPPLPPKPQSTKVRFALGTTRISENPPPIPPHRGKDENENLSFSVSAEDVKCSARAASMAVSAFERSKYGPTVVKQVQERRKELFVSSTGKPSVPLKLPLPKNSVHQAAVGPTVVFPNKSLVSSARKKFEIEVQSSGASKPTVIMPDKGTENKPLPWSFPSRTVNSSSPREPTIIRPNNSVSDRTNKTEYDDGTGTKSVKALRDQLHDKITFRKPTIITPQASPMDCTDVHYRPSPERPQSVPVKRKTPPPRPPSPAKHLQAGPLPPTFISQESDPRAIMQFEFAGENFDELSCMVGDTILLKKDVDSSWYYGCNTRTGQNGIVPKKFLNVVVPLESMVRGLAVSDDTEISSSCNQGPRVYTLYDYKSLQSGDLTFCHGEIVSLLNRLNADWLEGETQDGRKGIFPASYVEVIEDLPTDSSEVPLSAPVVPFESLQLPAVCAVYDYYGSSYEDLTFKAGDNIVVSGKLNADWLWGSLTEDPGNCGMFPASFVDKVPPDLPEITHPNSGAELLQESAGFVGKVAFALYDYHSDDARDLYFFAGDKITVTSEEGSEWLRGKLFETRTVPEGLFPRSYVQFQ